MFSQDIVTPLTVCRMLQLVLTEFADDPIINTLKAQLLHLLAILAFLLLVRALGLVQVVAGGLTIKPGFQNATEVLIN